MADVGRSDSSYACYHFGSDRVFLNRCHVNALRWAAIGALAGARRQELLHFRRKALGLIIHHEMQAVRDAHQPDIGNGRVARFVRLSYCSGVSGTFGALT